MSNSCYDRCVYNTKRLYAISVSLLQIDHTRVLKFIDVLLFDKITWKSVCSTWGLRFALKMARGSRASAIKHGKQIVEVSEYLSGKRSQLVKSRENCCFTWIFN